MSCAWADANPYLAYAAILAAGLDGIKNQIEPPPMFAGEVYAAQGLPQVPKTLNEAIHELDKSTWARAVFGDECGGALPVLLPHRAT